MTSGVTHLFPFPLSRYFVLDFAIAWSAEHASQDVLVVFMSVEVER
jgi:hypothetical protein